MDLEYRHALAEIHSIKGGAGGSISIGAAPVWIVQILPPILVEFCRNQPKVKVKAFSIWGINDAERAKLQEDIERAKQEAMNYASSLRGSSGPRSLEGTVAIHNETSLLVATGPESFVDMVESIVTACQAKERARNPTAPMALPNAPGR